MASRSQQSSAKSSRTRSPLSLPDLKAIGAPSSVALIDGDEYVMWTLEAVDMAFKVSMPRQA